VGETLYDEARVPRYVLPDALSFADGRPIDGPEAWRRRRAEILGLFEAHVYGRTPEGTGTPPSFEIFDDSPDALGGRAVRRQVRITVAASGRTLGMDLLLYLPAASGVGGRGPAPVLLGLNFGGNHTVAADPAIRLPASWVGGAGSGDAHRATDAGRGRGAWPVEAIVARGYGLATLYCGDVEPDHAGGFVDGVRGLVSPEGPGEADDAWGALGAWAWGLSRALDYLRTDAAVDGGRVAVMGHSRLGKAALWAGAQDGRFALVVSNNSGCGGAALFRREYGERVANINTAFPHWFCPAFRRYNDREADLPIDQHMLIALVAPRPVYVASAQDDRWADPKGEFLAALGADPVYRLLGCGGMDLREMPEPEHPTHGTIGYHIRPGGHGVTPYDWARFLDFADRHLGRPADG